MKTSDERNRETYNKIAKDWCEGHKTDEWWKDGATTFAELLKPGGSVLDVGCAGGMKTTFLREKGFTLTGIDNAEAFIKIAKEEEPESKFLVMDMRDVDSLDQKFDGIIAQASLLHLPKKEIPDVLKKFDKILKPEGLLYISVKKQRDGRKEEETIEHDRFGHQYALFFNFHTKEDMERYQALLGYELVWERESGYSNTTWLEVILKKPK